MISVRRRIRESGLIVYLVFILSIAYLGFLALSIHEGIFYAGDQGLKALVVKQIAQGYGFKYLHLGQPAWVQSIWNAGFTPLRPPSFYNSPEGYLIVFPPGFQLVSAWLYEKWGIAGLYVIPMLSTVVLMWWFIALMKRSGVRPVMVALGLFVLVFCSPLALYGVMFWEHLPAVLLLFAGLAFLVRPPVRIGSAVALGVVSGFAVWLRPEGLMMNLLYAVAIVLFYFRKNPRISAAFLAGLALPTLGFFVFNMAEYGALMGVHGRQVFVDNDPRTRMSWTHGLDNLWQNNYISTIHFLFVLLLIPLIVRGIVLRKSADPRPGLLAGIVVLFSILTPWVLPNNGIVQWGARYFLAIIPVTVVALLLAEREWRRGDQRPIPAWALSVVVLFIGFCFYYNTHGGGYKEVRWRYNKRLASTYPLIDSKPGNVVIVSHHWMINDFAYLFDKEYFFAASNNDSLRRLLPLLKRNGVHQYIFVFDPREPTLPTMLRDSSTSHWWNEKTRNMYSKNDYAAKVYTIQ